MRVLTSLWYSLRSLVGRRRADSDLDEELAFHIDREAAMLVRDGMSPNDARREAKRRFGGFDRYREECRDVRRTSVWDDGKTDVRYALRLAKHQPGFAANVIVIAALGIAACVTTFSLVSGILLAPLPFPEADRVYHLILASAGSQTAAIPTRTYLEFSKGSPAFEDVAVGEPALGVMRLNDETVGLSAFRVTPSFFRVYRLRPAIGRFFDDAEVASRTPVVVLGYEEWLSRFGGDPSVVGRQVVVNEVGHTIVGVMPPHFRAQSNLPRALWLPLLPDPARKRTVSVVLRLADSMTVEKAPAILRPLMPARMAGIAEGDSVAAFPALVPAAELVYGPVRRPLLILLGSVLLVLALVAANLATLFLAQSTARINELGVRRALGASLGRQTRQLLTESLTLTAIGGAVGMVLSIVLMRMVRALGAGLLPRVEQVSLDWRVAVFAFAVVLLTGLAGGVAQASARRRGAPLMGGATGRVSPARIPSLLVVAQVAFSLVLLVGAGLLVKGFLKVAPSDPGFELQNRAMVQASLRGSGPPDPAELRGLAREIARRMRGIAGVEDVAMTTFMPLTGMISMTQASPTEGVNRPSNINQNVVSANFFGVMGMRLVAGRGFTAGDQSGTEPVVILNEAAVGRWFSGVDPIGRRITTGSGDQRTIRTVIGVVSNVRLAGTDTKLRSEIYVPLEQEPSGMVTFIARTTTDPSPLLPALRRSVFAVAPRSLVDDAASMTTKASNSVSRVRFFSVTMGLFATVAVILSALGVYSLLSFAVAQRKREIGIRTALGATARSIGGLVLRQAIIIGMAGVVIGMVLARMLSRYLESLLLEVTPTDTEVFAAAAAAAFAIAVVAATAPAYRAIRVDPIQTLRE